MTQRTENSNCRISGLLLFVLMLFLSEAYAGPKYWSAREGRVLDAETGQPLAGVFVITRYWGDYPMYDSSSVCYHAAGTTTNAQGEYTIPSRFDIMDIKVDKHSRLNFFKPGYRHVFFKDGIARLEKEQGSREERLEYLRKVAGNTCSGAGKSQQALFPYYESIYYEAKAITVSGEDKKLLKLLRWWAASQAIASDREKHMDGSEHDRLIDDYMKDHLQ